MEKMCNSISEERFVQILNDEKRKQLKAEKERHENGNKQSFRDQTDPGLTADQFDDFNQGINDDDYGDEDNNNEDT